MKLNKTKWSTVVGLWWGLSISFFALMARFTGHPQAIVDLISSGYIGYSTSFIGILLGFLWGFVDMFVGVWILLLIYEWVNSWDVWKK